ncbi:hypothetical protein T484DRAFT_1985176 [Baffinella frigidus]|nr:hypothetical protein T484DRAFT_1985176 [Cryptophyta sp. CCMP2293]|mmetsp:Transcript_858/g.2108  ORF Transcript_858/g.2108 Transcript_858/m.2108 type:complete len:339 (+) Transcript_858:119-1135(+)
MQPTGMGCSPRSASLFEVIASMDEPFDSPDLVALPAAAALRGSSQPSFARMPATSHFTTQAHCATDAHHPGHAGHDEANCIDCWLYRSTQVPCREPEPLTPGGRKRAHSPREDALAPHMIELGSRRAFELGSWWNNPTMSVAAPATPSEPPSSSGSSRAASETPLGARDELRRKLSNRLARSGASSAATVIAGGTPRGVSVRESPQTIQRRFFPPARAEGGEKPRCPSPKATGILKKARSGADDCGCQSDKDAARGLLLREQKLDRLLERQLREESTFDAGKKPKERDVDIGETVKNVWDAIFVLPLTDLVDKLNVSKGTNAEQPAPHYAPYAAHWTS